MIDRLTPKCWPWRVVSPPWCRRLRKTIQRARPGSLCRPRPTHRGAVPPHRNVAAHILDPGLATPDLPRRFRRAPVVGGKWVPYYAGGAAWPAARYWGGDGSDFKRKTAWNGEQQIYVDPRYGGRETTPLGLDPFKIRDGILSIVASRTPPHLKAVLFNNEYVSGILTTQSSFAQKYGYFEIRSKIPVGSGVWPAFWMLADNGGWPPEVDVMEGRGQRPGDVVMTTHWRIPASQIIETCGFDLWVPMRRPVSTTMACSGCAIA